ncbi:MAG: type I-E CRISPR-associated protein Cse2/CasB [Actinobacteria bacterium]|nr:MAG: type I-E CRISPR-associated protein Cse2/CasB [Actinomycetota bacterium]
MTTVAPDKTGESTHDERRYQRRRRPFGNHVADTVVALQRDYLRKDRYVVAVMAHLRAALTTPPGYDYTILSYTRVPDTFLSTEYRDAATKEEQAKHLALALYAVHQQSIYDQPMHRDGVGLGTAISQLSRAAASEEAVRRRFAALGTAISFDEASYHLRSLIRLLRDKRIAIDYGLLADDLLALQSADGRARVRALWGREYYRAPDETSTSEESADVIDEASRIPDKE